MNSLSPIIDLGSNYLRNLEKMKTRRKYIKMDGFLLIVHALYILSGWHWVGPWWPDHEWWGCRGAAWATGTSALWGESGRAASLRREIPASVEHIVDRIPHSSGTKKGENGSPKWNLPGRPHTTERGLQHSLVLIILIFFFKSTCGNGSVLVCEVGDHSEHKLLIAKSLHLGPSFLLCGQVGWVEL